MESITSENITNLSGLIGVLVGGATSIATTWLTTTSQKKAAQLEAEMRHRKELYASYMRQLATMYSHALKNDSVNHDMMASAYAIRGQITLVASTTVLAAADKALKFVVDLTIGHVRSDEEMREMMENGELDVIGAFALACREELIELK